MFDTSTSYDDKEEKTEQSEGRRWIAAKVNTDNKRIPLGKILRDLAEDEAANDRKELLLEGILEKLRRKE